MQVTTATKVSIGDYFELLPGQYLALRRPDGGYELISTSEIKGVTALGAPATQKAMAEAVHNDYEAKLATSNRVLLAGGICLGLGIVFTGTFSYLTVAGGNILFAIGITIGAILLLAGLICLIVGAAIRPSGRK